MMARLPLTLACWDYDRTRALQDGIVQPEGIDLRYLPLMMPESFFRMLHFGEFHASEMSLGWYVRTVMQEDRPFIAIPVFPSRMFRHSSVYVNAGSGIAKPEDLVGRVVGCPEYQMTAAVWIKGILADRHGVPVNSVTYVTGGLEQPGRTEVPLDLPADIKVSAIPASATLSSLLAAGEIDALYTAHAPSSFTDGSGRVRRLWDDPRAVEMEYLHDTGIFPIMHTVVIRADVYSGHSWVAQSLLKAFEVAKDIAVRQLREATALKVMLPWLLSETERTVEAFGTEDFWSYGLQPNRATLATFLRYAHEQGLTSQSLQPEALFAPETLRRSRI
jgi:4,5-dihydroxyphthalate decarboxylase